MVGITSAGSWGNLGMKIRASDFVTSVSYFRNPPARWIFAKYGIANGSSSIMVSILGGNVAPARRSCVCMAWYSTPSVKARAIAVLPFTSLKSTVAPAARSVATQSFGVGVDASTLAARQSETSDLRKQVASALDEERKRVAKRAKELASVEGELAKLATKEQADVATLRGRLEGLSKRLAAANTDAKRKKDAYEAAAATASKLEQEKKELHEHLAMMVLSSEQRKEDKLKELLAAMGATDVS